MGILLAPLAASVVRCGTHSEDPVIGEEKGACYANGTCNQGLTCFSNRCVRYGAGGIDDGGSGGTSQLTTTGSAGATSTDDAMIAMATGGMGGVSGASGMGGTSKPDASAGAAGAKSDGGATEAGNARDGSAGDGASCRAGGDGLTNCGAGESCCTTLAVSGGTYFRTYTNGGAAPTGEADPATVQSFLLDKYDVTVGRFRQFVQAWNKGAGYLPPAGSGKHTLLNGGRGLANGPSLAAFETGWSTADNGNIQPTDANLRCDANQNYNTWTPAAGAHEKLPVNCVNWWEAYAFCIWDGGFLPSEAEWECAAAAGTQQREYPWGSTDPGVANQYAIYGFHYTSGSLNIAPVDSASQGAGFFGQVNLAGNVFQWIVDWHGTYTGCVDCANLTAAQERVLRGGDWNLDSSSLFPAYRYSLPPGIRNNGIGIRCAR